MCILAIAILGLFIERAFGRGWWIALLATCILATTAVELAVFGQTGYGSSGVLNSFYGFALVASMRRRIMPTWLLVAMSIWIGFIAILDLAGVLEHFLIRHAAIAPGGSVAHLTGLAWGMLFAAAFATTWKPLATRAAVAILLLASLVPLHGSPWLATWQIDRGERAFEREGVSAAIDWFTRAVQRDSKLASGYVRRAGMLTLDSRFAEALADVDQAIACQTDVPYARVERAQSLILTSELELALASATDELKVAGPSGYGYAVRGSVHFDLLHFDEAVADLDRAIKVEPRTAGRWVTRGSVRHELSQLDAALADAEQALSLEARSADAHWTRGTICADLALKERARSDLRDALASFEKDLVRMPRHAQLRCVMADILVTLFELDRAREHLARAREHADAAVSLAPAFWNAWQVRGNVKLDVGEFDDAVKDLTRALELNPNDCWAACYRGLALDGLSRTDEALKDLSRAVVANPRFAYGYRSRGSVRLRHGDFRGAIDDANHAIQLNPKRAEAYDIRGQARIASGEQASGAEDLKQAVAIDPSLAERRRRSPATERDQSNAATN
jgi:tetratricopeptide (TPR) repeat protein